MTEQELREKMAHIIAKKLCPNKNSHFALWGDEAHCYSRENFAECEVINGRKRGMIKDKEKQNKVFDILDKMELFQGQRAGRELWNDKPKEVQDKDISDFIKDINYIRSYLQDSVVLSREKYEMLANQYKNLEIKYSNLCDNYRLCKDANETLKQNIIITRKEIAEKILQPLYNACKEDTYGQVVVDFAILENLAKQFGVEIKE